MWRKIIKRENEKNEEGKVEEVKKKIFRVKIKSERKTKDWKGRKEGIGVERRSQDKEKLKRKIYR